MASTTKVDNETTENFKTLKYPHYLLNDVTEKLKSVASYYQMEFDDLHALVIGDFLTHLYVCANQVDKQSDEPFLSFLATTKKNSDELHKILKEKFNNA